MLTYFSVMLIAYIFILIFCIFWIIVFIEKPSSTYNKFKMNIPQRYISVDGEQIPFVEIESITVKETEQPSLLQRNLFHQSGNFTYLTTAVFHLKNNRNITCTFTTKPSLYNTLKQLKPFVPVLVDIRKYRTFFHWIIVLIYVTFMFIFFVYLRNPHILEINISL